MQVVMAWLLYSNMPHFVALSKSKFIHSPGFCQDHVLLNLVPALMLFCLYLNRMFCLFYIKKTDCRKKINLINIDILTISPKIFLILDADTCQSFLRFFLKKDSRNFQTCLGILVVFDVCTFGVENVFHQ